MLGVGAQTIELSANPVEHLADHSALGRAQAWGEGGQHRRKESVALGGDGSGQEGWDIGSGQGRGESLEGGHGAETGLVAEGGGEQE